MIRLLESWKLRGKTADIMYDDDVGKHSVTTESDGVRSQPIPAKDYWHAREIADEFIGEVTPKGKRPR